EVIMRNEHSVDRSGELAAALNGAVRGVCQSRLLIASAAALMCCVCSQTVAAFTGSRPTDASPYRYRLVLRIYDSFGLRTSEMDSARKTVVELLRLVSIQTEWHQCPDAHRSLDAADPLCFAPLGDEQLLVRIVAVTPTVPLGS